MDCAGIDSIKNSDINGILMDENMVYGRQSGGGNYAIGHYTEGKEIIDNMYETIRKQTEKCNLFQGFQIFRNIGSASGGGLGALVEERTTIDYPKKHFLRHAVFPSLELHTYTHTHIHTYTRRHINGTLNFKKKPQANK